VAHDPASWPGERKRRLAALSVALAETTPAEMKPLERAHLAEWLAGDRACAGDLARARAWASRRKLDPDAVAARAVLDGAVCDCELYELLRN
jgi:hypothetical protein